MQMIDVRLLRNVPFSSYARSFLMRSYSESAFFSVPAFDIYLGGILRPVMRMMIMYDQCCLHRGSLGFVLTDMLQLPLSFL